MLFFSCPNLNLLSIEDCIIRPELFTMYSWCLNYLTFLQITEKEYDCTDYLLCIISLINNGSFVNLKTLDVLLADSISRNDVNFIFFPFFNFNTIFYFKGIFKKRNLSNGSVKQL